jgi:hypothetical protein
MDKKLKESIKVPLWVDILLEIKGEKDKEDGSKDDYKQE